MLQPREILGVGSSPGKAFGAALGALLKKPVSLAPSVLEQLHVQASRLGRHCVDPMNGSRFTISLQYDLTA